MSAIINAGGVAPAENLRDDPAHAAPKLPGAGRGALEVAARGAEVGRPPAPGPEPVVGDAEAPAHRAPGGGPPGPHRHDYGIALDSDSPDDALETERPFE